MEMAEVEEWIRSINKDYKPVTEEEVQEFLGITNKETEPTETVAKKEVIKRKKKIMLSKQKGKKMKLN